MSEELLQKDLLKNPEKIGKWDFYNIGATSVKALKEHGIIRNVNYGKEEKKKVDGLIVHKKNVIAVIEYKRPSEFKTKTQKNKAIKQEIEVAKKLGAHIIIGTDTKESIWVNVLTGNRIKDENGKEVITNFEPKNDKLPELILKIKQSINELNDQIKPKELINPTDLAKSIWQDIWSVSGESPTNCLYTFVELFIFKYLSDLKILGQGFNFISLMERFSYDTENPNEEALDYYARNIRPKIKKLFPINPLDQTTIINGTVFVNKDDEPVIGYSTVFKKVLEKFYNYNDGKSLENIDYDFKSQLFEVFLKEGISKKNLGQYFTPLKVVRAVSKIAKDEIKSGVKICDPACGVGKFLLEPIAIKLEQLFKIKKGKVIPQITLHGFDKGFDKDEQKTIILAKANMLIYFSDLIKENPGLTSEFSTLFNETFTLKTNSILGTLSDAVENEYDLIFTNPPYVTSGSSNLKAEIKKNGELSNYYKINAMGVEGLFMEWIIRALKPNGKAFVVVPDGMFNRDNDKNIRQFILDECYIDGVISLPVNTFFTTPKKTYILCLTKKENTKDIQNDPVFTYLVSEIGESRDIYRFDIDQDDLDEAVTLYSFFKGNKSNFNKINTEKRCKIQPIDLFDSKKHWSVDKWWSKEEKVKIGIIVEKEKVNFKEVSSLIDDVGDTIKSFSKDIKKLSKSTSLKIKYRDFLISEIFDLAPIKGLTKTFINKNKGEVPVYGGKINKTPIGYVMDNLDDVKYFENCLGWNREGSVGYVFLHDERFTTNDHHRPMILKESYKNKINLEYARYAIESVLLNQGFKWSQTASKEKVAKLTFKLPINAANKIDIKIQNTIANKQRKIALIKESITDELEKLSNMEVDFE